MAYVEIQNQANGNVIDPDDINQLQENITVVKATADSALTSVAIPLYSPRGLTLSNTAGDLSHDITISTGVTYDSTYAYILTLSSAITKQIDAGWTAGTGAGGLDTGAVGNTTEYFLWLIRKDSDGSIDALFSASSTAPTMPAGYTYKRLLRGIRTDGSANIVNNQWLITDVVNDRPSNLFVVEQQAQNQAGTTSASAGWRTRVINLVKMNEIPGASISANTVILPAGHYIMEASFSAYAAGGIYAFTRLYNNTAGAVVEQGLDDGMPAGTPKSFNLKSEFVLTATSALEIQLYPAGQNATCPAGNIAVEIYLQAHFQKIG